MLDFSANQLYIHIVKSRITSKGQITIPIKIRRRLKLKPGQLLEFDENASFVKATKVFNAKEMHSVIGCCKDVLPGINGARWLNETRGPVELPDDEDAHRN